MLRAWTGQPGRRRLVVAALLAAIGPGCAEELGPEPLVTTTVTGQVRIGDRPVGGGWVEFLPVDGAVGHLRSVPLDAEGRFAATRVAVGPAAIRLVGAPPLGVLDPRVRGFLAQLRQAYLIHREIPPDSASPLVIDLAVEAYRPPRGER